MKRIVQKALAGLLALSLFGLLGCKKESILPPTVKVHDGAIMVSYTSARVAAEVVDQGGAEVKSRGFVFGLPGSSLDSVFCGNGLGVYSAEINNLLPNTTYIYEAFARNAGGTSTSGKVTFTTQDISMPTVKTGEVTEVTTTTALCGGEVTNDGGATVSERGVCLSTEHNPGINDRRFASGHGVGIFSVETTGLLSNTTYYVRAYAINAKGIAYGEEKSFDTDAEPEQNYTISVEASPSEGGTVSGGGIYQEGQSCTVEAAAKPGYTFTKWTENGNEASTSARYTFNVNSDRTLVANFIADTPNSYTISVSANPTNGGTVTGGGMFEQGQSCTVNATAAQGYSFSNWTENGNAVSTNAHYTFNVTGNRTLVANFVADTPNSYTISVAANPTSGGTVTGGGTYQQGQSCTVSATANSGYTFLRWTENGQQVSTNSSYTFTVTGNRTLVAQFHGQSYTISVSANPTAGGTVNGGGTYNHGQSCTVKATPANGYEFLRWTENGQQVSSNANYTFNVTSNRTLVAQFQAQGYTISISANPSSGGTVSGGGNYNYGQNCTVSATAATGYTFLRWTENGNQVSTNANYTFTVSGNRTLVAQFQAQSYMISASANPTDGGSVTGGGSYNHGQSCTLTASAATGYTFTNWTEGGSQVSTNANYTFNVTSNRTLVANFTYNGGGTTPIGAINGKFTINSSGDKVYFSQGNLQYQASTNTWRFAENQYDYVGNDNNNISQTYSGWIDLFGWGTSGYNHGAVCYQPWSTSQTNNSYQAYGQYTYNLYNQTGQADWGYNAISNGGNNAGQWRTLTGDSGGEWYYILCVRSASTVNGVANARYAKAKVANVQGVILFPDEYTHPGGVAQPVGVNAVGNTGWNGNNYSASDFALMQDAGAVFLPAAGCRSGTSVFSVGSYGYYWSASSSYNYDAYHMDFYSSNLHTYSNSSYRYYGRSVRLVCPAEN